MGKIKGDLGRTDVGKPGDMLGRTDVGKPGDMGRQGDAGTHGGEVGKQGGLPGAKPAENMPGAKPPEKPERKEWEKERAAE